MERHDEQARTARDAAAEEITQDHPARPEQPNKGGFETGYDQERDTEEERLQPNYARGISAEDVPGTEPQGRFSQGHEELPPDTPEKIVERRFSEGVEESPTSE